MTAILRRLPFHENADEVSVGLERVRIRPYQIIVWVSLSAKSVLELPPHAPRFPAILDTGHNHNFSNDSSLTAIFWHTAAMLLPVLRFTSACRSSTMICSGVCRFPFIFESPFAPE